MAPLLRNVWGRTTPKLRMFPGCGTREKLCGMDEVVASPNDRGIPDRIAVPHLLDGWRNRGRGAAVRRRSTDDGIRWGSCRERAFPNSVRPEARSTDRRDASLGGEGPEGESREWFYW